MTDYKARVKTLASGLCLGSEAMRTVILDMIRDGVPGSEAEGLIIEILQDVFGCDDFMPYLNDYREMRMRKAEGCDVLTDDTIFDVEGCAKYMKRTENWIYKNSHKLPHIQ